MKKFEVLFFCSGFLPTVGMTPGTLAKKGGGRVAAVACSERREETHNDELKSSRRERSYLSSSLRLLFIALLCSQTCLRSRLTPHRFCNFWWVSRKTLCL